MSILRGRGSDKCQGARCVYKVPNNPQGAVEAGREAYELKIAILGSGFLSTTLTYVREIYFLLIYFSSSIHKITQDLSAVISLRIFFR